MRALALFPPLAVMLTACELITGPQLPEGAVRMDPLPVYEEWWRMTEQCSALGGDFSRVAWYVVPGASRISVKGIRDVQGIWLYGDRIVFAGNSIRDGQLVRHEMLHALLQGKGHPRADFLGRCGGLVACNERCRAEGKAPSVNTSVPRVTPSAIEVTTSVWPAQPHAGFLEGYVRFTVTARNPADSPVIVSLPVVPTLGTVGFQARCTAAYWWTQRQEAADAVEHWHFLAGETKRFVFEYWVAGGGAQAAQLNRGDYTMTGAYGTKWATPLTVTIR
jgi:hypothetical protein